MYILNKDFILRKTILGVEYLSNYKTGDIYDLNETALLILKLCINYSIDEVIENICEEYDFSDKESAYVDVLETIDTLCNYGVLENV